VEDRKSRVMMNSKGNRKSVSRLYPSVTGMAEGDIRYVMSPSRKLRQYVKINGKLYWFEATGDGNSTVEKNLNVLKSVKIGKQRTEKQQPTFLAYNSASDTNIAINTNVTVDFDTEVFDIGSNFSSSTFTAPVTGKYFLQTTVALLSIDTGASYYSLKIATSNRTYWSSIDPNFSADTGSGIPTSLHVCCVADMESGDTAVVYIYQSSGTQQTDILGNATNLHTFFSGYLLG